MTGAAWRLETAATVELRDELAAELVERGKRQVAIALEPVVERGEFVGGVAKAAELRREGGGVERVFGGGLQWNVRCDAGGDWIVL